jgi:predicted Zn-dependent protease
MDLILLPSQMVLQIHESIGHPLELDRILGDERNYAGTSFVTPEMFGSYRYGSKL